MMRLNTKGKAYAYPGRGILTAAPAKLPKAAKAFADLSAVRHEHSPQRRPFEGDPALTESAEEIDRRLAAGDAPSAFTEDDAGVLWWLLSPTWHQGWNGTPAVLTLGKRVGEKLATFFVAQGGIAFALRALHATWCVAPWGDGPRRQSPHSSDIDLSFWYLERQFAGFSAVRTLRERLATAPDAEYAEAARAARSLWPTLPLHLRAAMVFMLPTERDLAEQALADAEATGPYCYERNPVNLGVGDADSWPACVALLAWSLSDRALFARTLARSLRIGSYAWAAACLTLHPDLLPAYPASELERMKLVDP